MCKVTYYCLLTTKYIFTGSNILIHHQVTKLNNNWGFFQVQSVHDNMITFFSLTIFWFECRFVDTRWCTSWWIKFAGMKMHWLQMLILLMYMIYRTCMRSSRCNRSSSLINKWVIFNSTIEKGHWLYKYWAYASYSFAFYRQVWQQNILRSLSHIE